MVAGATYPFLPETVALHWGISGEADGWGGRIWGAGLGPLLLGVVFFLFSILPTIDPLQENVRRFERDYNRFFAALAAFLFYLHALSLIANLGVRFNMGALLSPALGGLWFVIGGLLLHAKQNWFIGIRTPWTLSSGEVWDKTHELGGRLFKACGALALLGILFPAQAFYFAVVPVALVVFCTIGYSYIEYQNIKRKKSVVS